MKKLLINCRILFIILLMTGMSTITEAQRSGFYRHEGGGDFRHEGGGGDFRRPAAIVPQGFYNRGYGNGYNRGGYQNVYAPPAVVYHGGYSPYYGQRYYGIPRGSISLSFGGNPYY